MHANEEAQVYVHDPNLLVTVQLLEKTLAVLSLGTLCEDHGYSYQWVSGQKPRLTKEVKTIICNTDNYVPLVIEIGAVCASATSSTAVQPAYAPNLPDHTGQLSFRSENIVVGL